MTTYKVDDDEFAVLQAKTILLTGCSTGIGRETAYLAHSKLSPGDFEPLFRKLHNTNTVSFKEYGANLILGDWAESEGQSLAAELKE